MKMLSRGWTDSWVKFRWQRSWTALPVPMLVGGLLFHLSACLTDHPFIAQDSVIPFRLSMPSRTFWNRYTAKMEIPNVQYQRFSWTHSFWKPLGVRMLTQCLRLAMQQTRRMVISWGWNQSISRKKMTAFLYEGLVKTHLTRSTWGPTCQPKHSHRQKLLRHLPQPIFLDHRQGSYSKSPLLTIGGFLNVLQ